MKPFLIVLSLSIVVGLLWAIPARAALCPAATPLTACFDFTEASGVLTLKETVVIPAKDGVDLPQVVIPASSPIGGATQSSAISTVACVSDTYTAKAFHNYTTQLGVMPSLTVTALPAAGVVKDRTAEPACLKVPTNFTGH